MYLYLLPKASGYLSMASYDKMYMRSENSLFEKRFSPVVVLAETVS